jgi:hypothetical protein
MLSRSVLFLQISHPIMDARTLTALCAQPSLRDLGRCPHRHRHDREERGLSAAFGRPGDLERRQYRYLETSNKRPDERELKCEVGDGGRSVPGASDETVRVFDADVLLGPTMGAAISPTLRYLAA